MKTKMVTPQKAAQLLGVCVSTLRRWESDGAIEARRTLGGHRRYRRADVLALRKKLFGENPEP